MIDQQQNVLRAAAQWGQVNGDYIKPVEQVFTEPAFTHQSAQINVGGGDHPHIHLDLMDSAQVHKFPVLKHAQDLRLRFQAHGADFVQEDCASVGNFKQAFFGRDGAGECTFHMAKERGFEQVSRHGAGIHRNKRAVLARRIGMDGLGDQLFAGAALALNQNRRAAGRNLRDQVENLQHGLALADNILEVIALLQGALKLLVFFFSAAAAHRGPHVRQQLLIVPGLLDEVSGAILHGADSVIHGAVSGNHDHRQLWITVANIAKNLQSVAVRQGKIQQHQIKGTLAHLDQSLLASFCRRHGITLKLQQSFQRFTDGRLIIDNQHRGGTGKFHGMAT